MRFFNKSTEIFFYQWPPFISSSTGYSSKGTLLLAGKYEWPFELEIKGSTAETIEGLTNSYILYMLKATITRGSQGSAIHSYRPIRIVRSLDLAALDLAGPVTVAGVWSDKIEYRFCIPQKAISFGTSVIISMSFTSLMKGMRIGITRCTLLELQEFTVAGAIPAKSFNRTKTVDSWNLDVTDEDNLPDENGQSVYGLNVMLPLPKQLSRCIQDTDVCGIKIRHQVHVSIDLHDAAGKISEVSFTHVVAT